MKHRIIVADRAASERLDVYMANALGLTRSHLRQLWSSANVQVNHRPARASFMVQPSDVIEANIVKVPTASANSPAPPDLPIVYEDTDTLVVNKPAGLLVHSGTTAPNNAPREPTVVDFIRSRTTDPEPNRPGIVHRLDRDTSGLLVLAKSAVAKTALQQQFRAHTVHKTYLALVVGSPKPAAATIELRLDRDAAHPLRRTVTATGRTATTQYRTLASYPGFSLVEAKPETGRTHQIRVHLAAVGHPVAGDTTYGPGQRPLGLKRQFLHATALSFTTPSGQTVNLESPLPPDLAAVLTKLENQV